jgi:hypothetical protein
MAVDCWEGTYRRGSREDEGAEVRPAAMGGGEAHAWWQ